MRGLLMGELSYRPGLTCEGGKLCPEWRALVLKYPARFLIGSDTWVNERRDSYEDLPADIARRIAWDDGTQLFGVK